MTTIRVYGIRVHARKDTESKLSLGIAKADPFVIFRLGGSETKTAAAEGAGKVASWSAVTLSNVDLSRADSLVVIVKDKNTLRSDSVIGEGSLPLRELQDASTQIVRLRTSSGGDGGELEFSLDSQGRLGGQGGGRGVQGGDAYATTGRATTTTTSTTATGVAGERSTGELHRYEGNPVCDVKTYTTTEDRPITREVIQTVVEHRAVQKEFEVITRPVGERELLDQRRTEILGTTDRIVRVTEASAPCSGAPSLEGVRGSTHHHHGGHHVGHRGATTGSATGSYTGNHTETTSGAGQDDRSYYQAAKDTVLGENNTGATTRHGGAATTGQQDDRSYYQAAKETVLGR